MKSRTSKLAAVQRAAARAAAVTRIELTRGVKSLACIAITAPLTGFVGTVIGVLGSFKGLGTEKSTSLWSMAREQSEALLPTALGLLVAVLAYCFYNYLSSRLENFDIEMENASLELIDELARL